MEQRSLRLGDIVDDYCPRERRVTNHAIVAIVDDTIRRTRCSTCDAEHEYKEARVPRRRVKAPEEAAGVLVASRPVIVARGEESEPVLPASHAADPELPPTSPVAADAAVASETRPGEDEADREEPAFGWLAHRPLIRATLPRTDNDPPPRAIPEFTMHQRQGRGGFGGRGFRYGPPGGNGLPNRGGNDPEPDGNRLQPSGKPGRRRRRRRRR